MELLIVGLLPIVIAACSGVSMVKSYDHLSVFSCNDQGGIGTISFEMVRALLSS